MVPLKCYAPFSSHNSQTYETAYILGGNIQVGQVP